MFEVGKYTLGNNKYWKSECSWNVGLLLIPWEWLCLGQVRKGGK